MRLKSDMPIDTSSVIAVVVLLSCITLASCEGTTMNQVDMGWESSKNRTIVESKLPTEFQTPTRLSLSTPGWEDGLNISRDGLHLYATYIPADFLSFVLNNSADPEQLPLYGRGPRYTMDFTNNPTGMGYAWYHSDIIYSRRLSENE